MEQAQSQPGSGIGKRTGTPPCDTVARVEPFLARMGITRIANVTGLDRIGIPVVMVCRPNARSIAVSQGKGLDLEAATAAGLMEATELYHAEHIELPLKLGTMAELSRSHRFAEVERLAKVSGARFTSDLAMLWIEGTDLVSGESRWLPYESVRADFTLPAPPGSGCFDCSSNGLASGNSREEAIHHAICEIVERDATALWNRLGASERRTTGLDLGSVEDSLCQEVLARFAKAEFQVAAWETTSDVGVPSIFCLVADRRDPQGHHGVGAAAHPVPETALLKALIEAAQVRATYVSGTRDDLQPGEYGEDYRESRRLVAARLLSEHVPTRRFETVSRMPSTETAASFGRLLHALQAAGLNEVIAVDLSKDDIGIPVVRVVIPGMEGPDDHDGYVPGARARLLPGSAR